MRKERKENIQFLPVYSILLLSFVLLGNTADTCFCLLQLPCRLHQNIDNLPEIVYNPRQRIGCGIP